MTLTLLALASFAASMYSVFVAMCLWNWFMPPFAGQVSFIQLAGITAMLRLLTIRFEGGSQIALKRVELGLKTALAGWEAQVAYEKAADGLEETLGLANAKGEVLGAFLTSTIVLVVGFAAHALFM